MDAPLNETSKLKTYVIAGSIGAVIVGLTVVILLIVRQRSLATTGAQPSSAPSAPASGAAPSPSALGGKSAPPSRPQGLTNVSNVPPDYGKAKDSDQDGLTDPEEAIYGTDPHKADTDGDGYSDYDEIRVYGTNPLDPKSNPKSAQGLYQPNKGQPGT